MRVIGGAVSGGTAPTAFSWAMELTPLKAHARATAMNVLWVLGPLLIAAWHVATRSASWRVEAWASRRFRSSLRPWRVSVPESPEFLAARAAPPPRRESEVYGIVGHRPRRRRSGRRRARRAARSTTALATRIVARAHAALVPLILGWATRVGVVLRTCLFRGRAVEARRAGLCAAEPCGRAGLLRRGLPHEARGYGPVMVLFSCLAGVSLVLVALKAPALWDFL